MKRVAWLASRDTLPGPERRSDAFEYDRMQAAFDAPMRAHGIELVGTAWDSGADWSTFDAALIGTTWDYWDRHAAFLETLAHIEATIPLFNPVETVRTNSDKRYLAELPTPPTWFVDRFDADAATAAFERFDTDRIVVKRQVGAGAYGQHLLRRGDAVPELSHPMLVQPFLPSIAEQGEISVIVIDGQISHALRKRPAAGDYRIQSMYGGTNEVYRLTDAERDLVERVAPVGLLYSRVDLVRYRGEPCLMELELIEPYLYPDEGPQLGERLAEALAKRL